MNKRQTESASTPQDHAHFFEAASPDVRARLEAIQARVEQLVPEAEKCVSYGMPAFRRGKVFFYFAAFKKHIGVYPPVRDGDEWVAELTAYRGPKGNLIFPHSEPLPLDLIGRVALALAKNVAPKV